MGMSLRFPESGPITAWCDGCGKRVLAVVPAEVTGTFRQIEADENGIVFCGECNEFLGEVVYG